MRRAEHPVILLAFANPKDDLHKLREESDGIASLFSQYGEQVEMVILESPSLETITTAFREYRDRVAIFHYGGHASAFELMLESSTGEIQTAGAAGLAEFLSQQTALHLVFLNGCSTKQQVDDLLAGGVDCVIATNRAIDDGVATYFSLQFYESLTTGADLKVAFHEASGAAKSSHGGNTRAHYQLLDEEDEVEAPKEFPWDFYAGNDRADKWSFRSEVRQRRRSVVAGSRTETASVRQLQSLLQRMRDFWIAGWLSRIEQNGTLLNVNKTTQSVATTEAWDDVREAPDEKPKCVHIEGSIVDVFDDSLQSLLILGQPGAGKTTSLVELTRELVFRAEHEPEQPVPVIFHLSTWNKKFEMLHDWLQNELRDKYQVPQSMSPDWIDKHRLILLLDGLDEVTLADRENCVKAIDRFLDTTGAPGVVVTCRIAEHESLSKPLTLGREIRLQPLSDQQIYSYLDQDKQQTQRLGDVLRQNESLRDVARAPLMLGIMREAFADADAMDAEKLASPDGCESYLFDSYIDRMFTRRKKLTSLTDKQDAMADLSGIARRMIHSGSTILLIEDIQPSWAESRTRWIYSAAMSTLLGLNSGMVVWFFWSCAATISDDATRLMQAGFGWWIVGMYIVWFLAISLMEYAFPKLSHPVRSQAANNARGIGKMLLMFAIWCVIVLVVKQLISDAGPADVPVAMMCGTMLTLIMGSFGFNHQMTHTIQSVDLLGFHPKRVAFGVALGAVAGVLMWLPYRIGWDPPNIAFFWEDNPGRNSGFFVYLVAFVVMGMQVGGLTRGLRPRMLETKTRPNQGMRMSLRNGLVGGLLVGAAAFITVSLMFYLQKNKTVADGFWFSTGSAVLSLYCCFHWFGGFQVFKHIVLRVVLLATGQTPKNLALFLEDATQLKILQRVGGGYMFLHRMLGEHFATKE